MKTIYRLIILLVVLSISLIGCTSKKNDSNDKPIVYLIVKTTDNPFFIEIQKGVSDNIMHKYSLMVRGGKDESDVKNQMQVLESIIEDVNSKKKNIGGVILTPASSGGELIPYIKRLVKEGIPVILVDTRIDKNILDNNRVTIPFIGSSNKQGGKQAADLITSLLPKGGRVLVLNGVTGQETAEQRFEGFMGALNLYQNKNNINYKLTVRTANWRRSEALKIVSGLYAFGNEFNGIFAANDEMAMGAYQAVSEIKNKKLPIIIGFDAVKEAVDAVKSKKLTATIAQSPYKMGKEAIFLIDKMKNNEKYESELLINTELIQQ